MDETFTPACLLAVQPAPGGSPTDEALAGQDSEPSNLEGQPGETDNGAGGEDAEPGIMARQPSGASGEVGASDIIAAFLAGFRSAAGPADFEAHIVEDVIPCEWGWQPWQPGNGYLSRAQFDPQSWESAGGGDPTDDYQVGANVARWMRMVDPGGSGGWPNCWGR